jgi:ABC-type sugar transport system ATPase subunit
LDPVLKMKGISKYIYDGDGKALNHTSIKILDSIDFEVRKGEVHILMGENGAGKSTLMKVLGGIIPPDEGQIVWKGTAVHFQSAKEARANGISFIHQELNLCTNIDVAHNIVLGREPMRKGFIDKASMYEESRKLLLSLGFGIDPKTMLGELSPGQQQVVEIVKALSYWSDLIIMDEPTASLSRKEIDLLFRLIGDLKQRGVSIIYISHRFEEILEIGDRITVLRDGKYVGTRDVSEVDYDDIVQMMVGRTLRDMYACSHQVHDEVVLEADGVKLGEKMAPISISVNKGEIVGIGGLVGSGRTELAKTIFGARKNYGGEIRFFGDRISDLSVSDRIRLGIAYVSEDRKLEGLITAMDITQNITLASLYHLFPNGFVVRKKEALTAGDMVERLKVYCKSIFQKVNTLSGGNQQRVALAKWLAAKPKLLILDEPTRGIDVNAKAEIYKMIDAIAGQGLSVLMISSDLPELIGMSDRIYVMRDGEIAGEITDKQKMTQAEVISYSFGETAV